MNDGRDFVALYKQTKLYKMCICSYFVIIFLTNIHAYLYVLTFIYFHCWWTTRQHHLGFWPSSLVILKLLQRVQGLFKNLQFHGCVTLAPEVTCWAIIYVFQLCGLHLTLLIGNWRLSGFVCSSWSISWLPWELFSHGSISFPLVSSSFDFRLSIEAL